MTLSNWIGIAVAVVIVIIGTALLVHFRKKFKSMDGFEGVITERGKRPRREDFNWMREEEKSFKKELYGKKETSEHQYTRH